MISLIVSNYTPLEQDEFIYSELDFKILNTSKNLCELVIHKLSQNNIQFF